MTWSIKHIFNTLWVKCDTKTQKREIFILPFNGLVDKLIFFLQTALNMTSRGPFHYSNSIEILYCSHFNSNNDCCKILQMTRLCCRGMCKNLVQFDASNWITARLSSRGISIVSKPHRKGPRQYPNLKMDMDGPGWHIIFKQAAGTLNAWYTYSRVPL